MKKFVTFAVLTALAAGIGGAQTKWVNPATADIDAVQNQAWPKELKGTFHRIPDREEKNLRKPLWDLSRNSAGLAIRFKTHSPSVAVRYTVEGPHAMPHMPATGVSGVDMYRINPDGSKDYCFGGYSYGDTIRFNYGNLAPDLNGPAQEYLLDLPLYNTVSWLEIGVPKDAEFTLVPRDERKPVVVYGTSIAQGACSSRPGMAWANIVGRTLDLPLVNLGFSGNGRLEPEMIKLLNEIDASVYILDCMPNLTQKTADEAKQLVLDAVAQIRAKSNTPILLVEHAGYSNAPTNPSQLECYTRLNRGQRAAFDELAAKGTPHLFYLTHDEIGFSPDAWVDYVHPSDLGAQTQANAVIPMVKKILNIAD